MSVRSQAIAMFVVCLLVVGGQATIDCRTIWGADGTPFNGLQCACQPNYHWSSTTNICEVDCHGLPHSTATVAGTWSVNSVCPCETNFFFNKYVPQCVINCSAIAGSNGINVDMETCDCKNAHYTWTVSPTFGCKLDCATINQNDGNPSADNANCGCKPNYIWIAREFECRIDCANVPSSLGVPASATTCKCPQGTTWNALSVSCKVACNTILNAAGANGATACNCITGYNWDASTLSCVFACS